MQNVFVGRQPIYDRKQNVFAYELLFRNSEQNFARIDNQDMATSQLVINTLTEIGLDNIIGKHYGFINLTRNFITGALPLPAAQDHLVLEILEDIEIDDRVMQGIERLKKENYIIALDDFVFHPHLQPLVELADIIKIDLRAMDEARLVQHVESLSAFPVKLLAEKVETQQEFHLCSELGFDYFQGYFFCKPDILRSSRTPTNRLALLNLLAKLSDPGISLVQIEDMIVADVTLSYRLLKYINSSQYALKTDITSIKHAIMLLGLNTVRSLTYLIVMSSIEDKPIELFSTALIRANICQLFACELQQNEQTPSYFTVGLFSVMDAIMDQPMGQVLKQLPLSEDISAAIMLYQGNMGQALKTSIAFEQQDWYTLSNNIVPVQRLNDIYQQSVSRSQSFIDNLESTRVA